MHRIAFCQTNRQFILLERPETEIRFSMAKGMFKMKMDINRHGPRLMPNNCKNLNPPYFLLPTTVKIYVPITPKNTPSAGRRSSCAHRGLQPKEKLQMPRKNMQKL